MTGAVVLAGRPNNGVLAGLGPPSTEALVPVGGEPMVLWVVRALEGCDEIDAIRVVGPGEDLRRALIGTAAQVVSPGHTLVENVRRGAGALDHADWLLIATSDIPLLRAEAVADFLRRCDREQGRLFYPIVDRTVYQATFPGSRRTYVRLADGVFTGGNIFLLQRQALEAALGMLEKVYANRKSPLRLAGLLGWGFLLGLLLGRLRITQLERHIERLVGVPGRAVITLYPEIGFDVDRPDEVRIAEGYLSQRTGG